MKGHPRYIQHELLFSVPEAILRVLAECSPGGAKGKGILFIYLL